MPQGDLQSGAQGVIARLEVQNNIFCSTKASLDLQSGDEQSKFVDENMFLISSLEIKQRYNVHKHSLNTYIETYKNFLKPIQQPHQTYLTTYKN